MLPLVIISTLTGVLLGLRYKVLILFPTITLVAAVGLGVGIARGDGPWSFLIETIAAIVALQVGYLGGSAIRFIIAQSGFLRGLFGPSPTAQNPAR